MRKNINQSTLNQCNIISFNKNIVENHPEVVQDVMRKDQQIATQDLKQDVKTDSNQAKSQKNMTEKQTDKEDLGKCNIFFAMPLKTKIFVLVFLFVSILALGLGLGFGLRKTPKARRTKVPALVASNKIQSFGLTEVQLVQGSLFTQQSKGTVLVSSSQYIHQQPQEGPKRFLQLQKQEKIDEEYNVHVTIPQAGITFTFSQNNQVSTQIDTDKLIDYAAKIEDQPRMLQDVISVDPNQNSGNEHPTIQQISEEINKAINQQIGATSLEFKQVQTQQFNFDASSNSFVLRQENTTSTGQNIPKRVLTEQRIRLLKSIRPKINKVIRDIKPQVVPIINNRPLIVKVAKQAVKDSKCKGNCTNSGIKLGQKTVLPAKKLIKQCVPKNSKSIRCPTTLLNESKDQVQKGKRPTGRIRPFVRGKGKLNTLNTKKENKEVKQ